MLPKINRIKKKKDFEEVFKNGAGFKIPSLILRVVKNRLEFSRVGIIVSQKVSKKAVERNKIRRRLSEITRAEFENIKPGFDLVFIALAAAKAKEFSEIKKDAEGLLKKAKCLNQ